MHLKNRMMIGAAFCVVALGYAAATAWAEDRNTIRQYQFQPVSGKYELVMKEVPRPIAGDNEVLVRVRATSLNRRDLNMLRREYDERYSLAGSIPLSDGAGEVIAVGPGVTRFKVGDRVAGIF
ncbi:MAG: alcohol dehydrogenase catalytic domain-containing protein, partial [Gammaproteobacteria bacterium]|nr:alcohol dehydrogenase catalytic domain-containing protein [Gammaproteobacteria bacterium]MDH3954728.1 alcohol dehydrogenase catalytic domain-containing protein [Gammaproteobacteria bacterium]